MGGAGTVNRSSIRMTVLAVLETGSLVAIGTVVG